MNIEALKHALIASRATIDSVLAQLEAEEHGEWMTVKDASAYLGESPYTIRSMAKSGVLRSRETSGGGKIFVWVKKSS